MDDALERGAYAHHNFAYLSQYLIGLLCLSLFACTSDSLPAYNNIENSNTVQTFIENNDTWRYFKGISSIDTNWNTTSFNDSTWANGQTGIGYGDGDDITLLSDMANSYISIYTRKTFNYDSSNTLTTLVLEIDYDDGFIAYINGQEVARSNMPNTTVAFDTAATSTREAGSSAYYNLAPYITNIVSGVNVLAIQVHNNSLNSSDLSFIPRLTANLDITNITFATDSSSGGSGGSSGRGSNLDGPGGLCTKDTTCGTLSSYTVTTPLTTLSYVPDNLSGITYVAASNSFFLIENGSGKIWEVDQNYNLIRTITTSGFGDAEDLVYLGSNNEFAIVNEYSKLYIGIINTTTTSLNASNFQEITFDSYTGNVGAEGVAFDLNTQTFYIVKEKNPRKLYSFQRPSSSSNMTITPDYPIDLETTPSPRVSIDVSAVTFDYNTGRLLILSDQDYQVVDMALDGTVFGVLKFPNYSQYEGLTFGPNGSLHFVSEINKYAVYQ